MCLFERHFFLTFPTFWPRLGSWKPLQHNGVPNLPNLPNLFPHVCVGAHGRACRRAHPQACAHTRACVTHLTLGRLGRLGRVKRHKGCRVPNLCPTSPRLGT